MTNQEYKNPASTTTIIVENNGSVLLVRRKHPPYKNRLCFPGGFLNCGLETLEECAQRELHEETRLNVNISDLELVKVASSPRRDPRGHVIDHVYYATKFSGEAKASDDAKEVYWRPRDNLPRLAFDHSESYYFFENVWKPAYLRSRGVRK